MDFITAFNNKMKLVILTNTNICYSDDSGWVSPQSHMILDHVVKWCHMTYEKCFISTSTRF